MNAHSDSQNNVVAQLRHLLTQGIAATQEALCDLLKTQGYDINQSKVSRLLRKLGAVKSKNEQGQIVYRLPEEPAPPNKTSPLHQMVMAIRANETSIIIQTSPGAAAVIARVLDYHRQSSYILGTIAGDDTILVLPQSNQTINKTLQAIEQLLYT